MEKLMELIDELKDSIPEGAYLKLCDGMKEAYDEKGVQNDSQEISSVIDSETDSETDSDRDIAEYMAAQQSLQSFMESRPSPPRFRRTK